MKITYTPGTDDGLVGKSYKVEITCLELVEVRHVDCPLIHKVKIKYEDGRTEWITGAELFDNTIMRQRALIKRVV
jgi:hypothetical protein